MDRANKYQLGREPHRAQPRSCRGRDSKALREVLGELPAVLQSQCHRWRFSRSVPYRLPEQALSFPQAQLTIAGADLATGDIEGAWCSGAAAAGHILRATRDPSPLNLLEH